MLLTGAVQAQQVTGEDAPVPATPARSSEQVQTLGEVRALNPDEEVVDLYRFKNPVKIEDNRFSRSWSEPPSPEQAGMSGGYLMMGINYGLMKGLQGLHSLTGGRDQIQSAVARPPPALSDEQQQRAEQFCQQDCER